jgi:predicted DNA-binding transcriptional regulator AlpA
MKAILERIEVLLIALLEANRQSNAVPIPVVADQWLRADEVMRILSISKRTLYNYLEAGAFDTRRMGGTRFYAKASVMRLK